MAGIGFELRKLLRHDSYSGLIQAYGYAGIISSGPWILSILGVMLVGVFSIGIVTPETLVIQFLVSVTYLMASSLIITGLLQLLFTRFIADRLFEDKDDIILPNLMGALTVTTIVSGVVGSLLLLLFFSESLMYELLMLASFVTLSNVWIIVVFVSGMKAYKRVMYVFAVGYAMTVLLAMLLRPYGLEGLLGGFFAGQVVLLFLLLALVIQDYPGRQFVAYDFLRRRNVYLSLAATGLLYNAGIWADKILFWLNPVTSEVVIGPLRASPIYDIPIFLAYLSIIPGMAVFLVRIETDFAESYDQFYNAVREGDTLQHIQLLKVRMVIAVRQGIYEIFKVQGLTVVILYLLGPTILSTLGISPLYIHLFNIDITAVGVQVLLLAILNVLFYLDLLKVAMGLCGLFALTNVVFTLFSFVLGPEFYGFGFAVAVVITSLTGLWILSYRLERLEYETFMLQ